MEQKKRIILAVTTDLSYDQRMQRISNALFDFGFEVTLVGRSKTNSLPLSSENYKQHRLNCWFQTGKLFYLEFNIRLFFWLLHQKMDYLTANDLDTVTGCYYASKLNPCIRVFDAHELFTEVPELEGRPFVRKVWSWIEATFVPKFDRHYTVSGSVADELKNRLGVSFQVVMNVPDIATDDLNESTEFLKEEHTRIILYQGAVNKGRGIKEAILAMQDIDDALLVIAGGGDILKECKSLTEDQGLYQKVQFTGYLKPEELKEWTKRAYVGLNLLNGSSKNYEYSLANKFFDYIIEGVPSINMDFIEYRTINSKFKVCLLLKSLTQHSISAGVKKLLTDQSLYNELKSNCSKASKEYNWSNEKLALQNIYIHG